MSHININIKSNCSGCYSCENICPNKCIEMKVDFEGFWYPEVDNSKCIDCGLCEKTCPIINSRDNNKNIPDAYACYSKDEKIVKISSSGGIFTLLASQIINRGGVVFGAAFNENYDVEHKKITRIKDLELLRGSKYVQSNLGKTFLQVKELLNQGTLVYFSGTPCQIDGLLCFLDKKYDNLICQDIVCHGVPSPKVWKLYLKKFKLQNNVSISFRDKTSGWENYSFSIKDNKGKFIQLARDNDYMKVFLNNLCLRPSCYNCHSKSLSRNSDLTLADFWGAKEIYPQFYNDKGISLVLINSKKGNHLFRDIVKQTNYIKVDILNVIKNNSSINKSAVLPVERENFFEDIQKKSFNKVTKKYVKVPIILKLKRLIRDFL